MDPLGVREDGLGVREDQKSKVLYPYTPLFQKLKDPSVVCKSTLGVHETYLNF